MRLPSGQEAALHEIVTALRETGSAVTSSLDTHAGSEDVGSGSEASRWRCAFCLLTERSAQRSLRALFAEFVNDPQVRLRFRRSCGFCREHIPLLAACGDALGVAILYADLADEVRTRWRAEGPARKPKLLARWLPTSDYGACPACQSEAEAEARYVEAFAQGLRHDEQLWEILRTGSVLCVRHVEMTAKAAAPREATRLIEMEAEKMDTLVQELEEFVRKNDYRFRNEAWGTERDAWRRALSRLRRL